MQCAPKIKAHIAFPVHFLMKNDVKCMMDTNSPQNADMSLCESVRGGTAYPIKIWLNLRTEGYIPPVYGMSMTIDEDHIRSEDQRRAYENIVLKKRKDPEPPELLTAADKAAYPALMAEMRDTVPGMRKLLANYAVVPHVEVQTLLAYHQYKFLKAILERLEAGPGVSQ